MGIETLEMINVLKNNHVGLKRLSKYLDDLKKKIDAVIKQIEVV